MLLFSRHAQSIVRVHLNVLGFIQHILLTDHADQLLQKTWTYDLRFPKYSVADAK